MITQEIILRINELAKKQREGSLTEAEQTEQAKLRRIYIDHMKNQVKAQLDNVKFESHSDNCSCGCHKKH